MKTMTKRTWMMLTSVVLALALVVALAACGGKQDDDKTTGADTTTGAPADDTTGNGDGDTTEGDVDDTTENTENDTTEDGNGEGDGVPVADEELAKILSQMYEKVPTVQEIALGDPMPIDLTGEDFSYWLGVTDATGIKSAIYSEPMMSSVAYSVCLIEAEEGADVEQLKEEIFNKVNAVKWLCVTAEKVLVTNSDNTILLVMTNAEVTEELYNAFSEVMDGKVGEKLERDGE